MRHFLSTALVMAAASGFIVGNAQGQCTDIFPASEVVFGFNDEELHGWTGDPGPLPNTDMQFVTEGTGSAEVDYSTQGNWGAGAFTVDLDEPQDWSKYGFIAVDVFTPTDSVDPASGWNELWLEAGGQYRGVRQLNIGGWRTLVWSLDPEAMTEVSRVVIGSNTGSPLLGPLYFDNFRAVAGPAQGMAEGDRLIAGFNAAGDVELLTPDTPGETMIGDATVEVTQTTTADFITEGAGALELDLTDVRAWRPNVLRPADPSIANLPSPVDLSTACNIKMDIFIPEGSHPAWYSLGVMLQGSGEPFEYVGSVVPGWNTFVVPVPDSARENLKDVDKVWFLVGSGDDDAGTWQGPIYLDSIRAAFPSTGPAVMFGDLNGDSRVNVQDATLSLRIAVGSLTPTAAQQAAADVNGDGRLNVQDTTLILRKSVGSLPKFPVEP